MNHLGDANKMVSDTPRTDAEYERLFEIYQNAERINGPLCCAFENDMRLCRQLERELNSANQIIRQQQLLEEENQRLTAKVAQLYAGAEEQRQRIKRLDEENLRMLDYIKQLEDGGDRAILNLYFPDRLTIWNKAKEDKP